MCEERAGSLLYSVRFKRYSTNIISLARLHATKYPDGWDFNGVSCNTDCNTANTCKTDGDDYILVPVASENGRNPEKSWTRLELFQINLFHIFLQILWQYFECVQCINWRTFPCHLCCPIPVPFPFTIHWKCW